MKRLFEFFVRGLLFFIPLVVTIVILKEILVRIDGWLGIGVPGVGFVLTIFLITLIGFLTSNILTRSFMGFIDLIFRNVPFVKLIYSSIKDLIEAFVGKKKVFDKPVIVEIFPESGGKALGFVTTEDLKHFGIRDHVVVYLPQSYNFAGQTLIFPKEYVTPLSGISSTEVMTFIVSGGVARKRD